MNARFFALALPLIATTIARADEHDADRHPADLPAALAVGDDKTLSIVVVGVGVQIYDCKDAGGGAYAWVFRAPEATLYSANGQVGTHYVGPTWEWQNGSTVVGAVAARVNSPDPNAIPWLRLTAVAHEGHGPLARVSTILRLATVGGKAPVGGCAANTVGAEARVPYSANYYFYKSHDNN